MVLPRIFLPFLFLVVTRVGSQSNDVACIPSTSDSSSATSCQKDHLDDPVARSQLRLSHLVSEIGSEQHEARIVKRQAEQSSMEECENEQLRKIMQHVVGPLLSVNRLKLGDIAQILQQSIQRATGKSYEITMGKADLNIVSHQMSESTSCRMRIGDYHISAHETPVQYDIKDLELEKILSNIDFGEPLGGSGYPGQQPFPHSLNTPPMIQPRVSQSSLAQQSSLGQSSTGQSSVGQSSVGQANLVQPNLVQPNLVQPNLVQPNLVQPNWVQPNLVQPNLVQPNWAQPNWVQPYPYNGAEYYGAPLIRDYGGLPAFLFGDAGNTACFSGDLIVETSEGPKRMSQLKTGDEVLSIDHMMISFYPIVMFLHRDEDLLAEFNVITTANGDSVKLTNDHLIFVSNCDITSDPRLVRAKEVTVDHCVMVVRLPDRMLSIDQVTNVTKVYERGIYAPLTSTGDIIVNDILSSCHSNLAVRSLQDSFFKFYRYLSFLIPETGDLPLGLAFFIKALDLFIPVKAANGPPSRTISEKLHNQALCPGESFICSKDALEYERVGNTCKATLKCAQGREIAIQTPTGIVRLFHLCDQISAISANEHRGDYLSSHPGEAYLCQKDRMAYEKVGGECKARLKCAPGQDVIVQTPTGSVRFPLVSFLTSPQFRQVTTVDNISQRTISCLKGTWYLADGISLEAIIGMVCYISPECICSEDLYKDHLCPGTAYECTWNLAGGNNVEVITGLVCHNTPDCACTQEQASALSTAVAMTPCTFTVTCVQPESVINETDCLHLQVTCRAIKGFNTFGTVHGRRYDDSIPLRPLFKVELPHLPR